LHILKELESCAHNWIIIVAIRPYKKFSSHSFLKFKELGAIKKKLIKDDVKE
jgi:hypothetical protein